MLLAILALNEISDIFVYLFISVIALFKTNQFFIALLLLPYTLLLRIGTFINPQVYRVNEFDTPFSKHIFRELIPGPIAQNLLSCILIFLIANFINRLVIQNRLSKTLSLLPGLFFILLASIIEGGLFLSPQLFSIFFIMLGLLSLQKTYKSKEAPIHIFNTSMYFSISSLLFPGSWILWLFGFISLLNLRSLKLNEFLLFFTGLVVPIFLLGIYYYWNDNLFKLSSYFQLNIGIFTQFSKMSLNEVLALIISILLIAYSLYKYNDFTMRNPLQIKKKLDVVYWLMLFSFLMLFFTRELGAAHFLILFIPGSLFIGLSYEKIKNGLIAEIIHILLILIILFGQFQLYR